MDPTIEDLQERFKMLRSRHNEAVYDIKMSNGSDIVRLLQVRHEIAAAEFECYLQLRLALEIKDRQSTP
jgi:Ser/Thr protein kinase RdoA (MazF antagonist)